MSGNRRNLAVFACAEVELHLLSDPAPRLGLAMLEVRLAELTFDEAIALVFPEVHNYSYIYIYIGRFPLLTKQINIANRNNKKNQIYTSQPERNRQRAERDNRRKTRE